MPVRNPPRFAFLLLAPVALTLALLSACASNSSVPAIGPQPELAATTFTSFDGDRFPYHRWIPKSSPKLVVIGFHGIAGASTDLRILGEHLREHLPGTALYAPDLRGQGNDPISSRRGDIRHRQEWINDAFTFTRLVRARHPRARVIWCGESMGSLIALHAATALPGSPFPCDGLILSSPIARISEEQLSSAQRTLLRLGATLCPRFKISLESLSDTDQVRVVKDVVHQEQVQANPYHVSKFTLRLLYTLGTMVEEMPQRASQADLPVLLLHGGNDIFSKPGDVAAFQNHFPPETPVRRAFYPESYHLLFYDHQSDEVLSDITSWLRSLPAP